MGKEKLLVMSNFSFSDSVFKRFVQQTHRNQGLFLRVCNSSLLKTLWEKKKLLVTSNFSFSHSVFYPFEEHSSIFTKFESVVCKLFQFGRVQNLSFEKGLRRKNIMMLMKIAEIITFCSLIVTQLSNFMSMMP